MATGSDAVNDASIKARTRRWDKSVASSKTIAVVECPGVAVSIADNNPAGPKPIENEQTGFWDDDCPSSPLSRETHDPLVSLQSTQDDHVEKQRPGLPAYYGSALSALHAQRKIDESACFENAAHQVSKTKPGQEYAHKVSHSRENTGKGKSKGKGKGKDNGKSKTNRYEAKGATDVAQKVPPGNPKDATTCKQESVRPVSRTAVSGDVCVQQHNQSTHNTGQSYTLVAMDAADEDSLMARQEEKESLEAIYGTEFEATSDTEWLVRLGDGLALRVYLPIAYPKEAPPTPVIELESCVAPMDLSEQLLEQWIPGEVCVYQWAEFLRSILTDGSQCDFVDAVDVEIAPQDLLENAAANDEALANALAAEEAELAFDDDTAFVYAPANPQYGQRRREFSSCSADSRYSVEIMHGEPFVDRKSTFQAHLAFVNCISQVHWVHRQLLSDKKIAVATHNIVAYRFHDATRDVLVSDNDDDGETAAGGRLAELLTLRGVEGVFVMVSRWFGGVHLGPDRFKDINRAAQLLLDSVGLSKHAGGASTTSKAARKGR